jgi:hypothetical protein
VVINEPWLPPLPQDGQYWLCLTELEALSLVEGIVLARTQHQARHLTMYLHATDAVDEKRKPV